VVTAACVYHHLSKQEQHALTCEARRVLRPGGVFVIFEHNPLNPATRLIVSRTPVDPNAVLLTGGECRNVVRAAGLAVEKTVYYLFLPERLLQVAGKLETLLSAVPLGGQYAILANRPRS